MKDGVEHLATAKFRDPLVIAKGERRTAVALTNPETLWFNTGTLCNIECVSCSIGSLSKRNRLLHPSTTDAEDYLEKLKDRDGGAHEIGFTGREPFMNPDMIAMAEAEQTDHLNHPQCAKFCALGGASCSAQVPLDLTQGGGPAAC